MIHSKVWMLGLLLILSVICSASLAYVNIKTEPVIRRNAEHIAVLIAQAEMFERRISEASRRIDRLGERFVGRQ